MFDKAKRTRSANIISPQENLIGSVLINDAWRGIRELKPGVVAPIIYCCMEPYNVGDHFEQAELRRLGAALSLANHAIYDSDHVLHGQ